MLHLQTKAKEAASHGLVAYLYGLGTALALLGMMGLLRYGWMAAGLLALLNAGLAASSLDRRAAWLLGTISALAGGLWVMMGGLGTVLEVINAAVLHMSGLTIALPLVAGRAAVLICLLCGAAAWMVTFRGAGGIPALVMLLILAVLLWLSAQPTVLWCLLPAVIGCVTQMMQASDEAVRLKRVLPLAAVTVCLSFMAVAVGGVTVTPMKEAADALRQKIYDLFFFTGPRDVFSLASEGYYPQGQGQLGGKAEPRDHPVMTVETDEKTYLRGVVKNVYTGRSWEDSTGGRRYLWSSPRWRDDRNIAFDMALPAAQSALMEPQTVRIRMLSDSATTMFVPQRVRQLQPGGDIVPYFNVGSEIFATRNLSAGDTWAVEAPLFMAGDDGLAELIANAENTSDPNWRHVNETYRALPDHMEQDVYNLTYEAVAGADTPYEAALALQNYLATHYAYTLDVDRQPPELDFVTTFLLLGKEGYCTYFASAMTVMCRMAGLPARYVEGYVAIPDSSGQALVTGMNGHAWTEVYFKGVGWVTFDATPWGNDTAYTDPDGRDNQGEDTPEPTPEPSPEPSPSPSPNPTSEPTRDQPHETPTPTPAPEPDAPTPSPEPSQAPEDMPQDDARTPIADEDSSGWWLWLLLLLLLAGAVALRIWWTLPGSHARRSKTEFDRWLVWTQAVHDGLRLLKLTRAPSETPLAFFRRVDAQKKLPAALVPLGKAESLMFYGHAVPLAEETQQARAAWQTVWQTLSPWQRILLTLRRAFVPRRAFHG